MSTPLPAEPARGPHLRLRRPDGLPPFEKRAAVAFSAAILPWLVFASAWAVEALVPGDWSLDNHVVLVVSLAVVLWVVALGGPIIAVVVGGMVHRRLRATPDDVRPRGLGMAIAARVIGWLTLALWAGVLGLVCLSMRHLNLG